jgi:extracellular factor (EF) 3-hydroxypalmitic acid methyl ester biosynthesis protein
MSFLDQMAPEHRERFESAAVSVPVARGRHLMRRGEPGGDIFLLRSGALEVVDARSTPEVVLACLEPGTVVGELGFLDDAPRSADVRATTDTVVLRWGREDLRALLSRDPALAADFFETLARIAATRLRDRSAAGPRSGASPVASGDASSPSRVVRADAFAVADRAKAGLLQVEAQWSTERSEASAVIPVLARLESDLIELQAAHPELDDALAAASVVTRELHPYLVRSALAALCLRRNGAAAGSGDVLAHVHAGVPGGDGALGRTIDRWLLDRPTLRALRAIRDPIVRLTDASLPPAGTRRVTLLDPGTPAFVGRLAAAIGRPGTVLTVVDPSREQLVAARAAVGDANVRFVPVQDHVVRVGQAPSRVAHDPCDVVVVSGLLEYLPDPVASGVLSFAGRLVGPRGTVLVTAMAPDQDEALVSWLLSWPTIRRSREAFRRVVHAAQLPIRAEPVVEPPGMLFVCGGIL